MKTKNKIFGALMIALGIIILNSFTIDRADQHKLFQLKPETRANLVTQIMRNKLAMNDNQFDKAYQINLKYAKLSQPYLKDENSLFENKEKLMEINTKRKEELKAILSPEQIEQAESIRKQWIDRLETVLEQLKQNSISNQ